MKDKDYTYQLGKLVSWCFNIVNVSPTGGLPYLGCTGLFVDPIHKSGATFFVLQPGKLLVVDAGS